MATILNNKRNIPRKRVAATPTNEVTRQIVEFLLRAGHLAKRNNTDSMKSGRRVKLAQHELGWPDIIVVLKGGFYLGVEVKVDGDSLNENQQKHQLEMARLGAYYVVVSSRDSFLDWYDSHVSKVPIMGRVKA